jgi:anti-anti-sigma factor
MKYHIIEENSLLVICLSGDPKKNEVVMAKSVLFPYIKGEGIKVIIDLKELHKFEPVTLIGVLNGIKKEVDFLKGCLKLCSLKPEALNYFKQNRLEHVFQIYEDREMAEKSKWRDYVKK